MPLSGYNEKSIEPIEKSKTSAKDCFQLKYPGKQVTDTYVARYNGAKQHTVSERVLTFTKDQV